MSEDNAEGAAVEKATSAAEAIAERRRVQRELLSSIEKHLGIPDGFILSLEEAGSDWEFMVKFGVLCEAALTRIIVTALHREELFDFVSRSNQDQRLALADQLGLISKADRQILKTVATVRNSFAHRVENLGRTLADFVLAASPKERAEHVNNLLGRKDKDRFSERDDLAWLADGFRALLFDYGILVLIVLGTAGDNALAERERIKWLEQSSTASRGLLGSLAGMFAHPGPTLLNGAESASIESSPRPRGLLDFDYSEAKKVEPMPGKSPV